MKTYYHNGLHQRNLQLEKKMETEKELDEILKGKIWMQKKIFCTGGLIKLEYVNTKLDHN